MNMALFQRLSGLFLIIASIIVCKLDGECGTAAVLFIPWGLFLLFSRKIYMS